MSFSRTRVLASAALLAGLTAGASGPADASGDDVVGGPGVSDSEIHVGVFNDFSGPIATIGTPAAIGSEIYFDTLNAAGGVCGRQVVVARVDTKYDTQVALQEFRREGRHRLHHPAARHRGCLRSGQRRGPRRHHHARRHAVGGDPVPYIYVYQTPFALEAVSRAVWAGQEYGTADAPAKVGVIYQADAYGEGACTPSSSPPRPPTSRSSRRPRTRRPTRTSPPR